MTAVEKVTETFEKLPPELQAEVLHFVDYIDQRNRAEQAHKRAELDEMIQRDRDIDAGIVKTLSHEELMKRLRG